MSTVPIPRDPRPAPRDRAADRARPVVFFAEDDRDLRRLLTDELRAAGYHTLSASTGHEMLKLLTAASREEIPTPDVLVMDVRMPRCGGLEVLTAIRLADWKQPVVMITGFGDPALHEKAAAYGATVILDKPIESEALVDMIDVLYSLSQLGAPEPLPPAEEPPPETLRSP